MCKIWEGMLIDLEVLLLCCEGEGLGNKKNGIQHFLNSLHCCVEEAPFFVFEDARGFLEREKIIASREIMLKTSAESVSHSELELAIRVALFSFYCHV